MTRSELLRQRNFRHGLCHDENGRKTRLYCIWIRMKQRCRDPNSSDYARYGGRGIKVCEAWNDYAVFHKWAMSNGYSDELSIDRINTNGDYCPENCRWITMAEQARNKRNNHFIEYRGEKKTLAEWAETLGIESSLLRYRLKHWGIEKTFLRGNKKRNETH